MFVDIVVATSTKAQLQRASQSKLTFVVVLIDSFGPIKGALGDLSRKRHARGVFRTNRCPVGAHRHIEY
jgi:hypothetical protein